MLGVGVGTVNVTANGYLTTSTSSPSTYLPTGTRVFHIHLISTGTASVLTIQNGQGGTTFIKVTGTVSTGVDFDFGIYGQSFPAGAYVTVDGNIVSAAIVCKADQF